MSPDAAVPAPPLRLDFDESALAANWRALDRLSGGARAGAAVKADAYGVGARRAVPVLARAGCRDFFVAHWREAAQLLDLVAPEALAVLHGPLTADEAGWAGANGVRPVLNSLPQVERWLAAGGGPCHLMVDTGINRLGLPLDALDDARVASLEIDILMSHLASAEEESALNGRQQERWMAARQRVAHGRASLANSAGIMLGAQYHGELTRPGLSLYGGVPCAALTPHIRQVVRPEAAILQVREIGAGDSVGYNATFVADRAMRVGVIALGYADGFLCSWSAKGIARGGGEGAALPVLGRVSMDMTVIDLGGAPELGEGDYVAIDYALPQASALTGLSQYELLTSLGDRFSR